MKKIHLYLLSVLSGILLSVSWPMNGFPFLLFVAFVPLLFVEDYLANRKSEFHKFSIFKFLYLAFFVWSGLTLYWIWNSTIFGGIMALLLNSLFLTVPFWVFHVSKRNFINKEHASFLLVFYWLAFEYLHLDWDLSWPWMNLGNGFAMYTRWVQWYEYTGAFGGTLWILVINILVFKLVKKGLEKTSGKKSLVLQSLLIVGLVVAPIIVSAFLYKNYEIKGEPAEVIISQPNIDPWKEQYLLSYSEVFKRTFDPVEPLITTNTEFVVCPESAIQEDLWHHNLEESRSILYIRKYIEKYSNLNLIIGASTFRMFGENEPLTRTARKFNDVDKYYEAFNTALFINNTPHVGMYHKSKLVPGPEKMPFQRLLRPLQNLAFDLGGTVGSLGLSPERTVFTSLDGKFKVPAIICYESVYGGFVAEFVCNGANLLFIITNDGWWGNTAGHKQHFSFAPLRAIETRRSVARSANTGISAFINQRGDIIQQTEYWKPAVLKASIPANNEMTFYVVHGDYIGRISLFISSLLILVSIVSSVVNRKNSIRR